MGQFMPSLIFIKILPVISYHVKSTNPEFFAPELSWSFFMAPRKIASGTQNCALDCFCTFHEVQSYSIPEMK